MHRGTLVLLRHGQSTWNLDNRFTGWTDVDLTPQGEQEAASAGGLLVQEGVRFDVVHTSLLRRAIRTAHLALEATDQLWLPVERHWRLNERHYGALQGMNKKELSERYGADQVFAWRRSYATPPPALELGDERHPASDPRYQGLAPEVLPATECLQDVVERVLPYWQDHVAPLLLAGRSVLVVAHGNSLRAILKHLEGVSDDDIADINIPTGVPRLYRFDSHLRPTEVRYLGDAAAVAAKAAAVAREAGGH